MVTLLFGLANSDNIQQVLGIILTGCEILIVGLTLISFFVKPESKVGKFLSNILKGLYKSKQYLDDISDKKEELNKKGDSDHDD